MKLKRLWDTTHKKMIWATNSSGKKGQCYVYADNLEEGVLVDNKGKWEVAMGGQTYGPVWEDVNPLEVSMGYYDTNVPTNIIEPQPTPTPTEISISLSSDNPEGCSSFDEEYGLQIQTWDGEGTYNAEATLEIDVLPEGADGRVNIAIDEDLTGKITIENVSGNLYKVVCAEKAGGEGDVTITSVAEPSVNYVLHVELTNT